MFIFATGYKLCDTQVGSWTKFFCRMSLTQCAASEFFTLFYILNFGVFSYAPLIFIYFELKKDSSSFYPFKFCDCQLFVSITIMTQYTGVQNGQNL
jgi:hypothetical protein